MKLYSKFLLIILIVPINVDAQTVIDITQGSEDPYRLAIIAKEGNQKQTQRKINMNKSVPFNKFYRLFNIISSLLIVLSIVLLIFKGLNFGVDFKGGTLIELRTTDKIISVSNIRDSLNQLNLGDVSVKNFGTDQDYLIKFEKKDFNNPDFISEFCHCPIDKI